MNSKWLEKEWRLPRVNDVVRDENGSLGNVTKVEGSLETKFLCVSNSDGTEIYTHEPAENFSIVEPVEAKDYFVQKFENKGFRKGVVCNFMGKRDLPLEIIEIDWSPFNFRMQVYLKSLTVFNSDILVTRKHESLEIFHLHYPSYESIFSLQDSGLKWRLEVNLVEKENPSWGNVGSPWEFMNSEDAVGEVEAWKERLKIRRVASVVNAGWKPTTPCWYVELREDSCRVRKTESFNGSPAYFPTALHAAFSMKMVPLETWKKALFVSQDNIFLA